MRTWLCLGRSLVRVCTVVRSIRSTVSTFALVLLPLVGFSDFVKVYSFNSDHTTSNSVFYSGLDSSSLAYPFYNSTFGFVVRGVGNPRNPNSIVTPSISSPSSVTNRNGDIDHPLSFTNLPNAVTYSVWDSVYSSSSVRSVFDFALSVVASGYDSDGLYDLGGNVLNHYYNFDYKVVVGNLLSSTNNVYRSLVLSHLSNISASVVNIDTGVSQLRPVLDDIRGINTTNGLHLSSIDVNTSSTSSNVHDIASSMLPSVSSALDQLHDDNLASEIDLLLGDDTVAWCNFLDWSVEQGYFDSATALEYQNALVATDPQRKGRSYSIPDSQRRFFVKKQIKHSVVEAVKMRGKMQTLKNNINTNGEYYDALRQAGGAFNWQTDYHLDSLRAAQNDWRDALHAQLQAWKTSDETGILNVRRKLEDIESNLATVSPTSTNKIPYTAYVTNYVTRVITNEIAQAADNVSSNVNAQGEATRDLLNETLFNPDYEGVNVKIKFPLRYQSTEEVNVHDEAVYNAIADGFSGWSSDVTNLSANIENAIYSISNGFSWVDWFERWDPFATNVYWFLSRYRIADAAAIDRDIFGDGFDESAYNNLPWFSRVEALLYHIAGIGTNSVDTADIEDDMDGVVESFKNTSTNLVTASERMVGNFGVIRRFAQSVQLAFQNSAAPVTDGITILAAGEWIGNEALRLDVDLRIQNALRVFFTCFWYLLSIVIAWRIVSFAWDKAITFLRWLWSVFDV